MSKVGKEYRVIGDVKVRSQEEEGENKTGMVVEGYALKFNTDSEEMFHYSDAEGVGVLIETIDPRALEETDMSDVRFLFNHDSNHILGRSSAGTLDLKVDDDGLYYRAELPNTTVGRDTYENIRLGNISQCSFAMRLDEGDYEVESEGSRRYRGVVKRIKELLDVSAVTYPAYKDTDVGVAVRSIEKVRESRLEEEQRAELIKEVQKRYIKEKMESLRGDEK